MYACVHLNILLLCLLSSGFFINDLSDIVSPGTQHLVTSHEIVRPIQQQYWTHSAGNFAPSPHLFIQHNYSVVRVCLFLRCTATCSSHVILHIL